jgi:hypothetical protein
MSILIPPPPSVSSLVFFIIVHLIAFVVGTIIGVGVRICTLYKSMSSVSVILVALCAMFYIANAEQSQCSVGDNPLNLLPEVETLNATADKPSNLSLYQAWQAYGHIGVLAFQCDPYCEILFPFILLGTVVCHYRLVITWFILLVCNVNLAYILYYQHESAYFLNRLSYVFLSCVIFTPHWFQLCVWFILYFKGHYLLTRLMEPPPAVNAGVMAAMQAAGLAHIQGQQQAPVNPVPGVGIQQVPELDDIYEEFVPPPSSAPIIGVRPGLRHPGLRGG